MEYSVAYLSILLQIMCTKYLTVLLETKILYFCRRFGAWVGEGNNWCSPYKGWQKIYENSPLEMIKKQGYENKKHLILGKIKNILY